MIQTENLIEPIIDHGYISLDDNEKDSFLLFVMKMVTTMEIIMKMMGMVMITTFS